MARDTGDLPDCDERLGPVGDSGSCADDEGAVVLVIVSVIATVVLVQVRVLRSEVVDSVN